MLSQARRVTREEERDKERERERKKETERELRRLGRKKFHRNVILYDSKYEIERILSFENSNVILVRRDEHENLAASLRDRAYD